MSATPQLIGALTLVQPWASAIITGLKPVENRGWRFPFALPATIAVHASRRTLDPDTYAGLAAQLAALGDPQLLPRSALLGTIIIAAQHEAGDCGCPAPWAAPAGHHWLLHTPVALRTPIPSKGALRIWALPPAHRTALEATRTK